MKKEKEVWEILNKERRKRKGINENIEKEAWKEHFMKLLGGGAVEDRVVRGWEGKRRKIRRKG